MTARKAAIPRETRLEAADWILSGLDTLATSGIDSVRVETLARQLGITKGSFYWHFKDRANLLHEMLAHWRRQATLNIIERLERSALTPLGKLRELVELPVKGARSPHGAALELAIRLWARSDQQAAQAVAEVDQQRLLHVRNLLVAAGASAQAEAEARAFLIYAYMLAEALVSMPLSAAAASVCETLLGTGEVQPAMRAGSSAAPISRRRKDP